MQLLGQGPTEITQSQNANIQVGPESAGITQAEYDEVLRKLVAEYHPNGESKHPNSLSQDEYNKIYSQVLLELNENEEADSEVPEDNPLDGIVE